MDKKLLYIFLGLALIFSCKKILPGSPADAEVLDGTIDDLSHEESLRFLRGDGNFSEVFTRETGLGSTFVATSCISCHAGDGKGTPFTTLTRFGQTDSTGNQFIAQGGPQLQNRALPGFLPEQIPAGATHANFTPPANTGLGFLDYVSDADIIAMSDPNDVDADGISGVPNWISPPSYVSLRLNAIAQNGKYIGRFGKKASAYDLLNQTVNAYNQDMGITTSFNPIDVYTHQAITPEISDEKVLDLVFYLRTLKAPLRRNQDNEDVKKGEAIFAQLNCIACHKPTLTTSYSPIKGLSYKEFHPYTDLLLHDMGAEMDDNYTEGSAKTFEWRTPPLWGLGLSKSAQGGKYFLMHDGRATSLEAAILLHGGEGSKSRQLFQALTSADKSALYAFLESL